MNNYQRSTLQAIFKKPVPRTLEWVRVESLLISIGANVIEGRGSRVRFELNGVPRFIDLIQTSMPSPINYTAPASSLSRQE